MVKTTIDLLRHGETSGGHRYRGITDDLLTAVGRQQMLNSIIKYRNWDIIISSPLCRCLHFAKEISSEMQLPLLVINALTEIDFGDWEGKTAEQISQTHPNELMAYYKDPIKNPPNNSENLQDFYHRITKAWSEILSTHQGLHVLIVSHAGVMRMLFAHILQISLQNSFRIQMNHACLSRIECFHTKPSDSCTLVFHHNCSASV